MNPDMLHRQQHGTASTVLLPAGSAPRGVVAFFHGGPTMAWVDWSWRWNALPYLEQGHAVILVDPAGSDGQGADSWRAAWRNWRQGVAASAVRTLRAALDQHRLADLPLAAMGGSFGGYLALSVACGGDQAGGRACGADPAPGGSNGLRRLLVVDQGVGPAD